MKTPKFFIILLYISTQVHNSYSQNFNGGLKAGFIASQISGDQALGFNKAGPVAGGWVNYFFSKKNALQFEILYLQKGSRKNSTNENPTKYILRLNYLEIPLMYKRAFLKKISGEIGISTGILFHHVEKDNYGEASFAGATKFKLIDFSIAYGIKYDFTNHLSASLRYQNSILPVRNCEQPTFRLNKGQHNFLFINTLEFKF